MRVWYSRHANPSQPYISGTPQAQLLAYSLTYQLLDVATRVRLYSFFSFSTYSSAAMAAAVVPLPG